MTRGLVEHTENSLVQVWYTIQAVTIWKHWLKVVAEWLLPTPVAHGGVK